MVANERNKAGLKKNKKENLLTQVNEKVQGTEAPRFQVHKRWSQESLGSVSLHCLVGFPEVVAKIPRAIPDLPSVCWKENISFLIVPIRKREHKTWGRLSLAQVGSHTHLWTNHEVMGYWYSDWPSLGHVIIVKPGGGIGGALYLKHMQGQ